MSLKTNKECAACDCSYTLAYGIINVSYCLHPLASRKTGLARMPRLADSVRRDPKMCGPTGEWWQPVQADGITNTIVRPIKGSLDARIRAPQFAVRRAPPYTQNGGKP